MNLDEDFDPHHSPVTDPTVMIANLSDHELKKFVDRIRNQQDTLGMAMSANPAIRASHSAEDLEHCLLQELLWQAEDPSNKKWQNQIHELLLTLHKRLNP